MSSGTDRTLRAGPVRGAGSRLAALERSLTGRVWLRWHMTLMLAAAFGMGFLANHLLLGVPVHHAAARWLLALGAGYATFVAALRLWLAYVGIRPLRRHEPSTAEDLADAASKFLPSTGSAGAPAPAAVPRVVTGGGRFGGAGASSTFDGPGGEAALAGTRAAASGSVGQGFGTIVDDVPGGDDVIGVVVLALVALVVAGSLLGVAIYLVVMAPELLSEVAFGAVVTTAFGHGVRRARVDPGWSESVLAATGLPLLTVAAGLLVAGLVLEHYFPDVRSLGEALRRVLSW